MKLAAKALRPSQGSNVHVLAHYSLATHTPNASDADILSNMAAIFGATMAQQVPKVWFLDPSIAIILSLYIIWSWIQICREQVSVACPGDTSDAVRHRAIFFVFSPKSTCRKSDRSNLLGTVAQRRFRG